MVDKTREMRRGVYRPQVYVVKSDAEPALRSWALSLLVEDRMDRMSSYAQYLTTVKGKVRCAVSLFVKKKEKLMRGLGEWQLEVDPGFRWMTGWFGVWDRGVLPLGFLGGLGI